MMQPYSCDQVRQLLAQGAQLVDVRSPMEFMQGALPEARNIPVQALGGAADTLDPARPVLVYCHSGQRSAYARMALQSMGFGAVHDLGAGAFYVECLEQQPAGETAAA